MTETLAGFDLCKIEGHVGTDVANPRMQDLCGRCGRLRGDDTMLRDVETERRWIREAADSAQYVADPDSISELFGTFRERRCGSGPWLDVTGRDWIEEALEEAADQANYVMAQMQQLHLEGRVDEDAGKCEMLLRISLGASLTAYNALIQYRAAAL